MQLDLFTYQKEAPKEAATLYRFPLCRRADLIRQIAAEIRGRPYADGKRHWNRHVQKLRRELRAAGLRSADIASEVHDYTMAVRMECLSHKPMSVSR